MAIFSYTALNQSESYVRGKITAMTARKAAALLKGKGLAVVNIKQEKGNSLIKKLKTVSTISRLDKIFFTRHLHTLLESGISLDQAMKIAADQNTNLRFKEILYDLYEKIRKGQPFHVALEAHKKQFSQFFINLIKVGEKSGTLDEALAHLLEQQEKDYDLLTKTRNAMIYPGIIISAAFIVVILMITFVIPTISSLLLEYGVDLPLTTKILIFTSNFFVAFWPIILIVFIAGLYFLRQALKTPRGKWYWESILLNLPVIKTIVVEFNLARFCRSMSALLRSGVAIDEALELSATVCRNTHYRKSITASIPLVRKGLPLTEVMHGYPRLYPPITTHMIEVGEKTGKSDDMFTRVAIFYEKSVLNTLNNLSSIIEPMLILMIGLVVGFIAVSILSPIWKFAQTF